MLGLSIDKLLIVAIAAAIIIGPARLPGYAKRLGEIVRGLRAFLDAARARAEAETGLTKEDWTSLDPRRYDPRRIVREALAEPAPPSQAPESVPEPAPEARPSPRYFVTGSSAHPRRVLVRDDAQVTAAAASSVEAPADSS